MPLCEYLLRPRRSGGSDLALKSPDAPGPAFVFNVHGAGSVLVHVAEVMSVGNAVLSGLVGEFIGRCYKFSGRQCSLSRIVNAWLSPARSVTMNRVPSEASPATRFSMVMNPP